VHSLSVRRGVLVFVARLLSKGNATNAPLTLHNDDKNNDDDDGKNDDDDDDDDNNNNNNGAAKNETLRREHTRMCDVEEDCTKLVVRSFQFIRKPQQNACRLHTSFFFIKLSVLSALL